VKRAILSLTLMAGSIWGPMAWGQIAQSHPEFCGLADGVNPPLPDLSATVDADGHAVLYVGQGNTGIPLPRSITQLSEVCPLSSGLLAVFGDFGGTEVLIVDPAKKTLDDSFAAYHPVISPDRRWIAFVKMYPLHGVDGSDQYMLYDLAKPAAANRPDGNAKDTTEVGRVIFPPGHENFPGSNINLPKSQQHHGGTRIHWAPDSRAIAFEDRTAEGPGLVLVTLDDNGIPSAFRHALTPAEVCGRDFPSGTFVSWKVTRAELGPDLAQSGGIRIEIDASNGDGCIPHILLLQKADFHIAKTEANARPTYTKGVIRNGREVIPPRQK
jgi:hypothetical protein